MSKNRGIGNYAYSQFKNLIEIEKENQYYCFNIFEKTDALFGKHFPNFHDCFQFSGKDAFLWKNIAYSDIAGEMLKNFLKSNEIDVFYITSPFDMEMIPYKEEWFAGVQVVATIYDIIPYVFKEHYFHDQEIAFSEYMERIDAVRRIDKFLVISDSVKKDLVKLMLFMVLRMKMFFGKLS